MHRENEIQKTIRQQYEGVINIHTSPLPNVPPVQIVVPSGTLICDHVPKEKLPWVCVANGQPLKRDYWMSRPVYAGDVISLHPVVLGGGGGGSRSILAAIATVVLAIFAPYAAAALGATGAAASAVSAAIVMVGTALINAVIAPKETKQESQQASNTYNVATSGNQAKLNQPIPVGYGRMRTFPDYVSQPYTEYTTATNEDGDQYFYALYGIGQGDYNITAVMLGDSDIKAFSDVEYKILKPGEHPTIVNPMVVTGVEVGGQILSPTPVGPFVACGPARRITHIGIDLTFAKGLTDIHLPTGKAGPMSVTVYVDIVEVNDAFKLMGEWQRLATETITGSSVTPQRRSFKYEVPEHKRYAVRLSRANEQSRNVDHYDEITWSALRGYLAGVAPLAANTTHLELRMRATEQLNSISQRKIGVLWNRLLRTWNPDTGMSTELVQTRNPMWALLDKWTNQVYGDRMDLERVDLENIYALAQVADARKDRFDFIFDTATTSYEADQLICRVLRSTPVRRNGVRSVVRDELNDLPVTAYTARNILRDSTSMQYLQITEETADGIILEYFDRNAFDWMEVECPAPGRTYTYPDHEGYNPELPSMENPVRLRIDGITGPLHAEREGLYHAAANVLRRKYATWSTEMQGALASYGVPVIFAPLLHNSVQSGDCAFFDPATNNLSLSDQPHITATSEIVLVRPDGSVTAPIKVTPGADEWSVKLAASPDFALVLADSRSERTKYVLMDSKEHKTLCKVLSISPQNRTGEGAQTYELFAVVEDNEVHKVDNHLIPAPDEDPDAPEPWTNDDAEEGAPEDGGGTSDMGPYEIVSVNVNSPADKPYFILGNDGRLTKKYRGVDGATTEIIDGYWFATSPQPNIGWTWQFQVSRPIAATDTENGGPGYMWVKQLEPQGMGNMIESEWLQISSDFKLEMDDNTDRFEGTIKFRTINGVIQSTHRLYMEAKKGT